MQESGILVLMRDLYLVAGMGIIAVVIGGLLYLFGPSSLHSDFSNAFSLSSDGHVRFTKLQEGTVAYSISQPSNYRISTWEDFSTLWTLIYGDGRGPDMPKVDFNNYEVLAVFDGSHSTDGYEISVDEVTDKDSVRTIMITHKIPDKHCRLSARSTSPFEIIQVPKTSFSLAHQDQIATTTCLY